MRKEGTRGRKRGKSARRYLEEMKERSIEGTVGLDWEEERRRFFENRELQLEELKRKRREREEWCNKLVREGREIYRRERWRRIYIQIIDLKYTKWSKQMV